MLLLFLVVLLFFVLQYSSLDDSEALEWSGQLEQTIALNDSDALEWSGQLEQTIAVARLDEVPSKVMMCPVNRAHPWPVTFSCVGHESTKSVLPMKLVQRCIGEPMKQTVKGTCTLVACTVAVEAVNRFVYQKVHGEGTTFPYRASLPDDLLEACRTDAIWKPGGGADVSKVLRKIREMGGVPAETTNAPPTPATQRRRRVLLPLRSWREHSCLDDSSAAGRLSPPERVAYLLYNNGPCIGSLWASPSYHCFDADHDERKVYSSGYAGAANAKRRLKLEERYPRDVGWHAVVCFGFRRGGKHVLVLDNHTPTGPRRWIDAEEFHTLYTLSV